MSQLHGICAQRSWILAAEPLCVSHTIQQVSNKTTVTTYSDQGQYRRPLIKGQQLKAIDNKIQKED